MPRKALKRNSKVLVCGTGGTGQLGLGDDVLERKRLSEVQGIPDPVDVCAGGMYNLVLTKNQLPTPKHPTEIKMPRKALKRNRMGKVLVCGTGQLGLGDDVLERKPDPADVCAGGMHNLVQPKTKFVAVFRFQRSISTVTMRR
ncbi:hypothetical protein KR067_004606 [Drosophila pandora]|nr:hypothetical protein KR067_004606 [Drosophila pandora]